MSKNMIYSYAEIDPETNMCIGVQTTSGEYSPEDLVQGNLVVIPVYDEEYIFKFYIDGNWYEDPEGTIPWTSSLL